MQTPRQTPRTGPAADAPRLLRPEVPTTQVCPHTQFPICFLGTSRAKRTGSQERQMRTREIKGEAKERAQEPPRGRKGDSGDKGAGEAPQGNRRFSGKFKKTVTRI